MRIPPPTSSSADRVRPLPEEAAVASLPRGEGTNPPPSLSPRVDVRELEYEGAQLLPCSCRGTPRERGARESHHVRHAALHQRPRKVLPYRRIQATTAIDDHRLGSRERGDEGIPRCVGFSAREAPGAYPARRPGNAGDGRPAADPDRVEDEDGVGGDGAWRSGRYGQERYESCVECLARHPQLTGYIGEGMRTGYPPQERAPALGETPIGTGAHPARTARGTVPAYRAACRGTVPTHCSGAARTVFFSSG